MGSGSILGGSGSFGMSASFIFLGLSVGFLVFLVTHARLLVGGGDLGAVGKGMGSGLGGGCRGLGSRLLFSSLSSPPVGMLPSDSVGFFYNAKRY